METRNLHEVYMEALRLHQVSWVKRLRIKNSWFKRKVFDTSHLPDKLWDSDYTLKIHKTLSRFENPDYSLRDGSGRFNACLSFTQALCLLLAPEFLNVNYRSGEVPDLERFKLKDNTFRIQIIDET